VLLSLPSVAWADEPSATKWAEGRVDQGLVKPLAKAESSRFSRERPPPRERRIRITQTTPVNDKRGRAFVTFAIDVRFGPEWHENDVTGCVYRGSGDLFVKIGDAYRPAAFLLGKNLQPVAGVCEEAPPARS
jgi:hypothetical protein